MASCMHVTLVLLIGSSFFALHDHFTQLMCTFLFTSMAGTPSSFPMNGTITSLRNSWAVHMPNGLDYHPEDEVNYSWFVR
jgi:hypothetical protein